MTTGKSLKTLFENFKYDNPIWVEYPYYISHTNLLIEGG